MDFTKLVHQYLEFCEHQKRLDQKTLKAYRIDLIQFTVFLGTCRESLYKEKISLYIQELHHNHKPKTVKRKIASIRAFFNYLEFEEIITPNPINKIHLEFREPLTLPKFLSLKTVHQFLKTANTHMSEKTTDFQRNMRLRNLAVLELLFATGLRVSELCSLRHNDINLRSGEIRILGKGSRERMVYVGNTESLAILKQYEKAFAPMIEATSWFFINRLGKRLSEQSVRNMVKDYTEKALIQEHVTPHMFRHTFATLLLEEDVDIRYIQDILGHSSITTTQIYTHVSQNKQRNILKKKHPRNKISCPQIT